MTADDLTVIRARTRSEMTAFLRVPYRTYRDDPCWVAPLEREQRAFLDRRRHPFFEDADAELFLARRGRQVVGRVAAIDNRRHNIVHGATDGFFGFFECDNDPEAAAALLDIAAGWLRDRGLTTVLGPTNPSTNYECGLLVDGFDDPPLVMMPYNPPYYPKLVEAAGFAPTKDLLSWRLPDNDPPAAVARVAEAIRGRGGVRVRSLDMGRFKAEVAVIGEIYHSAWADNWGFVPMSDGELGHLARVLKPGIRPELALVAEVHGEPAAFALGLPDLNQALRPARGRLLTWGMPIGLLRVMVASRRISRGRLVAVGINRRFRYLGIDAILYMDLLAACRRLGLRSEIAWTLANNSDANRVLAKLGAERTKTHRIYHRNLRAS